jgi:hypothetical protein
MTTLGLGRAPGAAARKKGRLSRLASFAAVGMTLLYAGLAIAGSYLDRAALVLGEGRHEAEIVRTRLSDKELSKLAHELARVRLEAAGNMQVPKEVVPAHPHLLLVLENYERAMDAAEAGEAQRFIIYEKRAHEEEQTFRSVLKELGWVLPEL